MKGSARATVLGEPGTCGKPGGLVWWSRKYLRGNGAEGPGCGGNSGHSGVSTRILYSHFTSSGESFFTPCMVCTNTNQEGFFLNPP